MRQTNKSYDPLGIKGLLHALLYFIAITFLSLRLFYGRFFQIKPQRKPYLLFTIKVEKIYDFKTINKSDLFVFIQNDLIKITLAISR